MRLSPSGRGLHEKKVVRRTGAVKQHAGDETDGGMPLA